MADKIAMTDYQESAFSEASGVQPLQQQVEQFKTDDASLRAEAEAQYNPTFEAEQKSVNDQLTALIKSQTDDSDLLNKQYQQSVNTMMAKLAERGIDTGALPGATVNALDKFHNDVMNQRQAVYSTQQKGLENVRSTLESNYELNIESRMATNRQNNLAGLTDLLTQIAKLQSASYQDYVQFLLANQSGGGGGRRRRSRGGSSASVEEASTTSTPASYFSGGNSPKKKITVTHSNNKIAKALSLK